MGQTEDCYIYDIVADNSIDTFISRNLDGKESLAAAFKRQLHELKQTEKDEKKKAKLGLYAIAETRDDAGSLTAPH